jgi:hypothetical protein
MGLIVASAASLVQANSYVWTNSSGGDWNAGLPSGNNWNFSGVPGSADSAAFNLSATYPVTFSTSPAPIQDLTVSTGNVTFMGSPAGGTTLSVTSIGGNQTTTITGTGSSLTLGAADGTGDRAMNLTAGNAVSVQNGGTLKILLGSQVNTGTMLIGSGTLLVDGASTQAIASGFLTNAWGANGGTATVTFSNGAIGTFNNLNAPIDLANDGTSGTTATLNILSGAVLNAGAVNLDAVGGAATSATLNINGNGSIFTQVAPLTVGNATSGIATINVGGAATFGGTLDTGKQFTINKTGTVNIGAKGVLDANGRVLIDGGVLEVDPGNFNLADSQSMIISGGGRASFSAGYMTASNAQYTISGAGSKLETTLSESPVFIQGNAQINVASGGSLSSLGPIGIARAVSDSGTLNVDGAGSSAVANTASVSAWNGVTSNVVFSNGATGSFNGGIDLAMAGNGQSVTVQVQSGAALNVGNLNIAAGLFESTAAMTVTGLGSAVVLNPGGGPSSPAANLVIGAASGGSATVNVNNGAALTVGTSGTTTLNVTGTLNINGGSVDLKALTNTGGTVNLVTGSLSYVGNLTVGSGGLLGADPNIATNQSVTLTGTTTIDATHTLTLSGGKLNTGSMLVNGAFSFDQGSLGFNSTGGGFNGSLVSNSPSTTINVSANNVSLGNANSFTGFIHQGTLNVGANTVTLNSAGYAKLGVLTSLIGGTINAPNGVSFGSGSNFLGHGAVHAQVTAELGSVIEADGALALGDPTSPAGFNDAGQLRVKENIITLNSSAPATVGNLTALGGLGGAGTINAANGLVENFGGAITGYGTINSSNTLAKHSIINGTVQGNSASQPITLSGWIKGAGTFNNVTFSGTYDPGFSPTLATVGNVGFASGSTLNMELGGTSRGSQYDAIIASGLLSLGGTLNVLQINGFTPNAGDRFDILDWGTLNGTFTSVELPTLSGTLEWSTNQLYDSGILAVVDRSLLLGDFNRDGHVDATDIQAMELALTSFSTYESTFSVSPVEFPSFSDLNGDSKFNNADLQALLDLLKSGGGSTDSVPEPVSWILASLAFAAVFCVRLGMNRSQFASMYLNRCELKDEA